MFNQSRQSLRQLFFTSWGKYQTQQPLDATEQSIVHVLIDHPEYHFIFSDPEAYLEKDFFPELGDSNPFLHLSLHLSIREQIATNRPAGIFAIHYELCKKFLSIEAEHIMLESLAETLWQAQRNNTLPDEQAYLDKLKILVK